MAERDEYLNRDPARQWEWHEVHRDLAKNMYRTSAMDMSHGREVHVKSDFPSGYGGHIQSLRYDVLHRNTAFDRNAILNRTDPSRDSQPSYVDHISGLPTVTKFPKGAKNTPTLNAVTHDGTSKSKIPWGTQPHINKKLSYRNVPATLARSRSSPGLQQQNQQQNRVNRAEKALADSRGMNGSRVSLAAPTQDEDVEFDFKAPRPIPMGSPGAQRMANTVNRANELAQREPMPSEMDMLREQMQG